MSVQFTPLPEIFQAIRSPTSSNAATQTLSDILSLLFEPSPALTDDVLPLFIRYIQIADDESQLPQVYSDLIDMTIELVFGMSDDKRAKFVGAHPRIGEVKGLSAMSAAEQGQTTAVAPTPAPVLERLEFLNAAYERCFPGLVYITFVNGRSREQIRDELEERLREEHVIPFVDEAGGPARIVPHDTLDDAWLAELERAILAIRDIAHSRLEKLGQA